MHDLRRKKKSYSKQMSSINNTCNQDTLVEAEEIERGCKNKVNNTCNHVGNQVENNSNTCNNVGNQISNQGKSCNHGTNQGKCNKEKCNKEKCDKDVCECECVCECKKTRPQCEPCEAEADQCVVNPCAGQECCNGITPTFSTRNASPVAIEADRVYDAVQFQIFTDATGPDGETLYFEYEVTEVEGRVPTSGLGNVTINEVCINYSSLDIIPGVPSVDDYEVQDIIDDTICDQIFEYAVCPDRNSTCCQQNRGQSLSYKERGLTVILNDLVLELKGCCGCTKIVANAYPAVRRGVDDKLCRVDTVEFKYNTLAARICSPSDGSPFKLRQDYNTSLAVDCISKAYITMEDSCRCDYDDVYELTIPSGIDLICCIEEVVSVLIKDRLIVLGVSEGVNPRVVDTFSSVCSFPSCGQ